MKSRLLTMVPILVALLHASCTSIHSRKIRITPNENGAGVVVHAKATMDVIGGRYYPDETIYLFGKGRDYGYRLRPGITFRYGVDFNVKNDYCLAGYLWISPDYKYLSIALFDAEPPEDVDKSYFNGKYLLTEDDIELIKNIKTVPTTN